MHAPYVCGFHEVNTVHGCMVYTERAETAAVSCGTSHASAVSRPLWWILKTRYKKLVTHVESIASAVSLLEKRRLAVYENNHHHHRISLCVMSECDQVHDIKTYCSVLHWHLIPSREERRNVSETITS